MWNVETVLDKVKQRAPSQVQNKITPSKIASHWTKKEWERIAAQYPAASKEIGQLSCQEIVCFPDEAQGYFFSWVEKYFIPMLIEEENKIVQKQQAAIPEKATNTDNIFVGKLLCFTGFYKQDKENIEKIRIQLNIQKQISVSKRIDYLICGSNASAKKVATAIELGIPQFSAKEFVDIITKKE